jgi:diaminopimelate epimerase
VEFATLTAPDRLRMRVWERGTGITLACGSGACATAVAAHRRGLTGRRVTLDLDGGSLEIDWREDGVWLTGPTAYVFDGQLSADFLAACT